MKLATKHKLFIARILSQILIPLRRLVGLTATAIVTRRGARWRLNLREGIDIALYLGLYELRSAAAMARQVRPGAIVLDIGANIGAHTLPLARLVGPSGRVVAFEPTDYAFTKLIENVGLNPDLATHIDCRQLMLVAEPVQANGAGATAGAIYSSWPLDDRGALHTVHGGRLMSTENAGMMRLDDCIRDLDLPRVDFVKIDVDGNEIAVLTGARETLSRFQPVVIMEFTPYLHGEEFGRLLALLRELGYGAETRRAGRLVPLAAESIAAICAVQGSVDLILRPASSV